ncbi:MAG TPA: hypothetical protein VF157_01365 [Chloroflexota bacterium]
MYASAVTAAGNIAVVQETRFRLMVDDGRGLLLTLSRSANVTPEDLQRFHREDCRVLVHYTGEPGLASAVATRVEPLS